MMSEAASRANLGDEIEAESKPETRRQQAGAPAAQRRRNQNCR